ncbi:MAG: ubiquinol-cytochrome c reductase iron-sulfur subunit [Candidatus Acidiferrales bacterium]
MNEKKNERDYTGWAVALAGAAFGWVAHKLFAKRIATLTDDESDGSNVSVSGETGAAEPVVGAEVPSTPKPFPFGPSGPAQQDNGPVGVFVVVCLFSAAMAAGIGFLFVYWVNGSHMLLGVTMALSMGTFGAALVVCAHRLMNDAQVIEERETLPSPASEREAVSKEFFAEHSVRRRRLLIGMSAGVLATFAASIVSLFRSLGKPPGPSLMAAIWKRGDRLVTIDGHVVSIDTLQNGSTISVFPENRVGSEDAQAVLIRVNEQLLRLPQKRANWAPGGYLAYSRVCTHAGCSVGMYQAETCLLQCPCHQSTFDVLSAARPTGGPAARPLPQLPLYADEDGNLRAGGDFSEPPGPGFWGMP